ncbi:hypothetical protein TH5_09275 [Thalassospira xianhensis MCCC 1A02616]|uniref:Uncharacterized protein n=2 Tax=Thalassospira TaxID=168934 RepID=A0A285TYX4_9PROT|nr:hypothetical protein TH5_09275 [Thalassospira xianhensis MCCC 1A02616]SOC30430.1 hypothetical protein SAMN05428964_10941 [Thalassospira xiamenensis]
MRVEMQSLFGATCLDEAAPPATDLERIAMLTACDVLSLSFQVAPALEEKVGRDLDNAPNNEPAPELANAHTPRPTMRM